MESPNFSDKIAAVKARFKHCQGPEEVYQQIIAFGRESPHFPEESKITINLVNGCQSQVYVQTEYRDGKVHFKANSDALISAGLAALLVAVYSGENPITILQNEPIYLQELGIFTSLTPNRANGLASIYFHMKKAAVPYLTLKN
ncbi:MAG: hypothetical protein K0S74_626 [Chlamydiales bacterium]|jgi:cysteine desulfuration protein SufE|nr:hypothetical protein [Chlamydiales bacterium]